ncbi:hypothetical protein KR018_003598 [Drosophila ironensis]|nr:hypothetical protein KR018_003598 [Drosophila ironensis]
MFGLFAAKKLMASLASVSGIGQPSVCHTVIVVFWENFAWGLLTMPMIATLKDTFPDNPFLMNGLVVGVKGILSFLSAPIIGALSDIYGRKSLLLITVIFKCLPIPLMNLSNRWFFVVSSLSGVLGVNLSVVLAYVADVTTEEMRSRAYGFISATYASTLVIAPALGNLIMDTYGIEMVVLIATIVSTLDVLFILLAVPESLPRKVRVTGLSWKQADPFWSILRLSSDPNILLLCLVVFLFLLPEAGEVSSVPAYLKLSMGFGYVELSLHMALIALLGIVANMILGALVQAIGAKSAILLGLLLEFLQLVIYATGTKKWQMWVAGNVAALSSLTFPAVNAYVSLYTEAESQGAVQGMISGMSWLCSGIGPAVFGILFYISGMDLSEDRVLVDTQIVAGPFVLGAFFVLISIILASHIPEENLAKRRKEEFTPMKYIIEVESKASNILQ